MAVKFCGVIGLGPILVYLPNIVKEVLACLGHLTPETYHYPL